MTPFDPGVVASADLKAELAQMNRSSSTGITAEVARSYGLAVLEAGCNWVIPAPRRTEFSFGSLV
ncbi:hypothetical protein PG993_000173 [Apiospora rasikravindrae]|uniref:Transposase n=1 Tax=Apiospora rasikravindrae TaxID=990691 RepID=A0ABR1U7S1_9PEZI